MLLFNILKRKIYNQNIKTYLGYSNIKYNFFKKSKLVNSTVYKLLKERKMKLPKNYKTQYETRDFK